VEYYDTHKPSHVEWIDDTSANLVYESSEIAQEALLAFAVDADFNVSQLPVLQTIASKPFPLHPEIHLQVRLAVFGDRKQAGARERSRFYLFNPEHDPAERRKRGGGRGARSYRDRDDGGYQSQRYDDREQRKRERDSEFDATLYDDDEAAIATRASRDNRRYDSSSGSESRGRDRRVRFDRGVGKELFPDLTDRGNGVLRNRSASPLRGNDGDRRQGDSKVSDRRKDASAAANRLKAQLIKDRLREASTAKELFPQKLNVNHRRSGAFDAADETADLFANHMAIPFTDGSADERSRKSGSLSSRIYGRGSEQDTGFSIRGAAKTSTAIAPSFNIKGAAKVKELFPATFGDNAGKELFSERLEGRDKRRQKAEDLFY
jgi:hypothetical protein